MEKGTKVTYHGNTTDDQVTWRASDDPRIHLVSNKVYIINEIIIHNWYTEIQLKGKPGKKFNSVFFKDLNGNDV